MIRISDLASLEVINLENGKILGLIDDLEIDLQKGRITAVVIPAPSGFWSFLSGGKEHVIPWKNIAKIGEDVILVRYREGSSLAVENLERGGRVKAVELGKERTR